MRAKLFLIFFFVLPKMWTWKTPSGMNKNHCVDQMNPNWPCRQAYDSRKMTQWGLSEALFSKRGSRSRMACNAGLTCTIMGCILDILNLSSQCGAGEPSIPGDSDGTDHWELPLQRLADFCQGALLWPPSHQSLSWCTSSQDLDFPGKSGRRRCFIWNGFWWGSFYPSFKYIVHYFSLPYIVHYFPHKSTSVNHFVICLFLEMKWDYIEQCFL